MTQTVFAAEDGGVFGTPSFFLDTAAGGWWFTLFTAVLGSVILLWIVGMVQRKT
jgi:uncharacterized membrane protein YeaQ/YmgE (transglycosylase-associated protein family)